MMWQPMLTAPKDGTEVILYMERRAGISGKCLVGHYMPGGHCIDDHPPVASGWYFWNGCMFRKTEKPLYWMPLPSDPELHTSKKYRCLNCGCHTSIGDPQTTDGATCLECGGRFS